MEQNDNNRMAGADLLTSVVFMAAGAYIIHASLRMRIFRTIIVSPGLFPAIIGGVFVCFGIVIFAIAMRRGGLGQARHILSAANFRAIWHSPRFKRGMAIFISILAYVLLFGNEYLAKLNFNINYAGGNIPVNVGFLIVTGGYLFFSFIYLRAMRWPTAAAVSLLAALAIFFAFSKGFGIPIP
jgi:hypothetical protein